MMPEIKKYLLSLVVIGFLGAVAQAMIPNGALKKCVGFASGLLLILYAVRPMSELEIKDIAQSIGRVQVSEKYSTSGIEADNRRIISGIIKEKCETYIWDKATQLGMHPSKIMVKISEDAAYPYPSGSRIQGEFTPMQKQHLSEFIEREFAITAENQEWIWNERTSTG